MKIRDRDWWYFFLKSPNKIERNYVIYDKEILVVIKGLERERDGIVEEPPSMCIMPTSNLLEIMGSIP